MILDAESWMNIRRFRALHEAGATYTEIASECGVDWRTVKKYLTVEGVALPPQAPSRAGTQPSLIEPFSEVIDTWLRADLTLKASVIHERLVAEYGFGGHYQRVKMYAAQARPRIAVELEDDDLRLRGLHRRFEVLPGAQAQVDWGEEGDVLAHVGIGRVYSFHMTLSFSRDPFCCYVTSMDLATFFDCHRRAFAHFGGVPAAVVYDRTKTVVKRHVAPGLAVPLHPEAAAFAGHYGFDIDVRAAYRPTGKGRVERQVLIVRDHVLAGRTFDSLTELQAAFDDWLPTRRAQVHRTHGQVIADRAEPDRAALRALPAAPYLVADRHLRRVGKDCLVSFEASLYSVPARRVRAGQTVELRVTPALVAIHALTADTATGNSEGEGGDGQRTLLACHARAQQRGSWQVDQAHWNGLPDGHTRATTLDPAPERTRAASATGEPSPLLALLADHHAADTMVARRSLAAYQQLGEQLAGTAGDGPERGQVSA
jgi:transposase